jgi:hypothetical protein
MCFKQQNADDNGLSRRGFFKTLAGALATIPVVSTTFAAAKPVSRPLKVLETRIAGFAHYEGEHCQSRIQPGEALNLKREPGNKHDANAIEVYWYHHKTGYVPRRHNAALSQLMDKHEIIRAQVTAVDYHSHWEPVQFDVEVWV